MDILNMTLQTKILFVDDDKSLRLLLKTFLTNEGFLVDCAVDSEDMFYKIKRGFYDLIVLDWNMPGENGLAACIRLKTDTNSPPILMLTANSSEDNCISCLKNGSDDYLSKPFNPAVLVAKINALLRSRPRIIASLPDAYSSLFHFGPFILDFNQRCLFQKDNRIDLTSNEFALLNVLAQHAGNALSREQLSFMLKGEDCAPEDRFIDVQVCRLRRLLENNPNKPTYLQTVRGVGYVLIPHMTLQ